MSITSAVTVSFKKELLTATHNFTATTGHTFKIALYTNSATLDYSTPAYTTSGEVTGTGYTAGGTALTSVTPTTFSTAAYCDFNDVSWPSSSITAYGCMIYNNTSGNKSVLVQNFGGAYTTSSGTFSIVFPTADSTNAIIRLA